MYITLSDRIIVSCRRLPIIFFKKSSTTKDTTKGYILVHTLFSVLTHVGSQVSEAKLSSLVFRPWQQPRVAYLSCFSDDP